MKKETFGLYGPEDSKYLRLVARRAEAEEIAGGPRGDDGYGSTGR